MQHYGVQSIDNLLTRKGPWTAQLATTDTASLLLAILQVCQDNADQQVGAVTRAVLGAWSLELGCRIGTIMAWWRLMVPVNIGACCARAEAGMYRSCSGQLLCRYSCQEQLFALVLQAGSDTQQGMEQILRAACVQAQLLNLQEGVLACLARILEARPALGVELHAALAAQHGAAGMPFFIRGVSSSLLELLRLSLPEDG